MALENELEILKNELLKSFEFSNVDRALLDLLFSSILSDKSNNNVNYSKRWSPGDLAPRNILVSKDGNFKLIDLEWARTTIFMMKIG